ncbi:MAG TPA: 16S rRNA (cytidine(1402)-2'-O)-methyltransferase, partial [Micromonosporaceae bacterium]
MDGRSGGGRLVLVGAPLGNPADASPRVRET